MKRTLTGKAHNRKRDVVQTLRTGPYGKCVFLTDNNVCDNQLVTMTFAGGATAVLEMNAFSDKMFRECHIVGTKGELVGYGNKLSLHIFGGKSRRINTRIIPSGHVEGDMRLIAGFVKLLCGETADLTDITTIEATVISHDIALAAERSRQNGGTPVLLGEA